MAEVEEMAREFEELAIVPSVSHGLRQTLSSSEATPLRAPSHHPSSIDRDRVLSGCLLRWFHS